MTSEGYFGPWKRHCWTSKFFSSLTCCNLIICNVNNMTMKFLKTMFFHLQFRTKCFTLFLTKLWHFEKITTFWLNLAFSRVYEDFFLSSFFFFILILIQVFIFDINTFHTISYNIFILILMLKNYPNRDFVLCFKSFNLNERKIFFRWLSEYHEFEHHVKIL